MVHYRIFTSDQIHPSREENTVNIGLNDLRSSKEASSSSSSSQSSQKSMKPHDLLGWSIVNALFFNIFLGIVAIVFSVLTRNHIKKNQIAEAYQLSQFAFKLNLVATTMGSIFWIIVIIVGVLLAIFLTQFNLNSLINWNFIDDLVKK